MTIDFKETEEPNIGKHLGGSSFQVVLETLSSYDSNLPQMLSEMMKNIFSRPHLTIMDRELCIIAALGVQSNLTQLKWHIAAALNVGVPILSIREVLVQLIPFAGWPSALTSLPVLREVAMQRNLQCELEDNINTNGISREEYRQAGMINGAAIYHNFQPALDQLAQFDSDLPSLILETSFGRIYSRPNLDMRHREMISVAMLAVMGKLPQLKSHIIGAHRVGCSQEETREILITLIGYAGWPVALNSLAIWKEVCDENKEPLDK